MSTSTTLTTDDMDYSSVATCTQVVPYVPPVFGPQLPPGLEAGEGRIGENWWLLSFWIFIVPKGFESVRVNFSRIHILMK